MPIFQKKCLTHMFLALAVLFAMGLLPAQARAQASAQTVDPIWEPLVLRLVVDGFDEQDMRTLFAHKEAVFDSSAMGKKMTSLFARKFGTKLVRSIQTELDRLGYDPGPADGYKGWRTRWAIKAFQAQAGLTVDGKATKELLALLEQSTDMAPEDLVRPETNPETSPLVYESIVTPERLAEAEVFLAEHADILAAVEEKYGVPPEIAVGLLTVETRVGKYLGEQMVFATLASMALCEDYSLISDYFTEEEPTASQLAWLKTRTMQKGEWAYKELKALIVYAEQVGRDPLVLPGSIYGAIGICQFMPTNALKHAVDGNNDGKADLFDVEDALHSLANYLKNHGWQGDMSSASRQRKVLYRYNASRTYVNTIMAVAEHLRQ